MKLLMESWKKYLEEVQQTHSGAEPEDLAAEIRTWMDERNFNLDDNEEEIKQEIEEQMPSDVLDDDWPDWIDAVFAALASGDLEDTAGSGDYDSALDALKTFLETGGIGNKRSRARGEDQVVGYGTLKYGRELDAALPAAGLEHQWDEASLRRVLERTRQEGTIEGIKNVIKLLRDNQAIRPDPYGYFYTSEAMDELLGVVGEVDPDPQPGTDPASIHERKNKQ